MHQAMQKTEYNNSTEMLEKKFRDSNYPETMMNKLNMFRKTNQMIDLTIVVEGREFYAHRVVMAAASESFLPSENNQSRVVLSNSNVTIRGFLPLLEYAYTSVLKVNQSDVTDCFLAAVHLHMQSISDYLRPYTNISSNTNSQTNPMQNLLQNNPDLLRHLLLLRNQPLGGSNDQSLQTILQLLQLQNMAKNGSMLPNSNNSTPTTPKSETECDVTDDQENAHLEVEETDVETNVENADEKSTDTPKNDSGLSMSDRSPMTIENRSEEKEEDSWGTNPNNSSNNNKPSIPQFDISKISPNMWNPQNIGQSKSLSLSAQSNPTQGQANAGLSSILMENESYIPPPGAIVGRTRTGKPLTQPELPDLPENGQYQSVRRRTLPTTVPKPHVCQICGSRFTRYHNLKQHIKLHSGVKPYECNICNKRFTRNYTLRLHKQKCSFKHGGGQQFQCGSCNFTGNNQAEFRVHLRMHNHHPANSQAINQAAQNVQIGQIGKDDDQNRPYGIDPGLFGPSGISLLALMQQQQNLQQLQQQQQSAVPSMTSSMTSPSMSNSMTHHDDSELEMKIDEIESEVDEAPMVISEAAPIESQEVH